METITIIVGFIIMISLLNIIDAEQRQHYSDFLSEERLSDLLLEAKRRGLFHNSKQTRHEDDYETKDFDERAAAKGVGLFDDPFKKRLLNLLLEAKRRGLFYNSKQTRHEDDYETKDFDERAAAKGVGFGDDPFKR